MFERGQGGSKVFATMVTKKVGRPNTWTREAGQKSRSGTATAIVSTRATSARLVDDSLVFTMAWMQEQRASNFKSTMDKSTDVTNETSGDDAFAQRPKCDCGWGEACLNFQRKLHKFHDCMDGMLTLELYHEDRQAMALKYSIDQILRVPPTLSNQKLSVGKNGRSHFTYHVAKLHWSKAHIQRHETTQLDYTKPLLASEAQRVLHTLLPITVYEIDAHGVPKTYLQSPTVPQNMIEEYILQLELMHGPDGVMLVPPKKKVHLNVFCICNWPDCRAIQQVFTDRINKGREDLRGGNCLKLDFSGEKPKTLHWKQTVLDCLNLPPDFAFKNIASVPVARHHWTVKQLEHLNTGGKTSTPLPAARIQELAYAFDPKYCLPKTKRYPEQYFQTPNVPHEVALNDARDSPNDNRVEQFIAQRIQGRLNTLMRRAQRQETQFKSLTLVEFQTIMNDYESLKKSRDGDKKKLDALTEENARLKAAVKEKDKLLNEYDVQQEKRSDAHDYARNYNGGGIVTVKRQRKLPLSQAMHFPNYDDEEYL
jgi:hypothetical protein